MMKKFAGSALVVLALTLLAFAPQKMKKVIFFGDSITQAGVKGNGYIVQMNELLKQQNITGYELEGAGIGGNKIYDLYLRLDKDVLDKKPAIVVIYVGVNDVWHKATSHTGTDANKFPLFYQAIIDKLKAQNIQPILCTMAVIGEKKDGTNEQDKELDTYAGIIRKLATDNQLPLVDLRKTFMDYYASNNPENLPKGILTTDGVHLNDKGNAMVAEAMWKAVKAL
jgi:lysophospholipase L1-like esterase